MDKRSTRAGIEDRWHRPARRGEQVYFPADQSAGPHWCTDPKHGEPGTLVCTVRHSTGKRWLARWVDHDGQERTKAFERQAEAKRKVAAVSAELSSGTYADPRLSGELFGTVAEEWIATKATKAPKTIAGYRSLLDVVVLPKWGKHRLRDITHADMQAWVTWLSTDPAARSDGRKVDPEGDGTGLSASRTIHAYQVASWVLGYAVRCKYLATNPAKDIELPRLPQGKELALTHEQVRILAEETAKAPTRVRKNTVAARTSPQALATMVKFMAYGGPRFGECVALRVGDVEIENRRVRIDRSATYVQGRGMTEGDTKTHSRRYAPILTKELLTELEQVTKGRDAKEYLFPGPDGGVMTLGWFRTRFDKAAAKLGVPGVTPHTLRHTAGSLAISELGSVVVASKLLGHRNVSTTANVYSHMLDNDWDRLAAAMERATTA